MAEKRMSSFWGDVADIALPAGAFAAALIDPQAAQAVQMAASIANTRTRNRQFGQQMEMDERSLQLQEQENRRLQEAWGAGKAQRDISSQFGQGILQHVNQPVREAPAIPLDYSAPMGGMQGPPAPVERQPNIQEQMGRFAQLGSSMPGIMGYTAAGGPYADAINAARQQGDLDVSRRNATVAERQATTGEAGQRLSERRQAFDEEWAPKQFGLDRERVDIDREGLGIQREGLGLKKQELEFDWAKLNASNKELQIMDLGEVKNPDGTSRRQVGVFRKSDGSPVSYWNGPLSARDLTDIEEKVRAGDQALASGDQRTYGFVMNDLVKPYMQKGWSVSTQENPDGSRVTTVSQGGDDGGKTQERINESKAGLMAYKDMLDIYEEVSLGGPGALGVGGKAMNFMQTLQGSGKEFADAAKDYTLSRLGGKPALVDETRYNRRTGKHEKTGKKVALNLDDFFSKRYTQTQLLANTMTVLRAAAFGQTNRSLSDNDVKMFKQDILQSDRNKQAAAIEGLRMELATQVKRVDTEEQLNKASQQPKPVTLPFPIPGVTDPQGRLVPGQAPQSAVPQQQGELPQPNDEEIADIAKGLGISVEEARKRMGL